MVIVATNTRREVRCRQVLNEFGNDVKVIFEFGGKVVVTSVAELLPYTFKL